MKPLLIAMVGLPRCGKSTWVAKLSQKLGAPIVRRDAIRLAFHGQRYCLDAEPIIKTFSLYMIKSLFEAGHKVVICDETNYSKAARAAIQSDRWETQFYPFYTSLETCKARALGTNQADLLPVLDEMWNRREPLEDDEPRFYHPETGDWWEEAINELNAKRLP